MGRADPWLEFVRPLPSDLEGVKNYSGLVSLRNPTEVSERCGVLLGTNSFLAEKGFPLGRSEIINNNTIHLQAILLCLTEGRILAYLPRL